MLTRVRLEAEGPTPDQCRDDLYAAADLLTGGNSTGWRRGVREEIYEKLTPTEESPALECYYRARIVLGFPISPAEQTYYAEKLRGWAADVVRAHSAISSVLVSEEPPEHGRTIR